MTEKCVTKWTAVECFDIVECSWWRVADQTSNDFVIVQENEEHIHRENIQQNIDAITWYIVRTHTDDIRDSFLKLPQLNISHYCSETY